jgi:hypothetical protein
MIRIEFKPPEVLPDAVIGPLGSVSQLLTDLKIGTFQEAARYVRQLPYGPNSTAGDSTVLLREGFGDCTTKHGLMARLAGELSLPVHRCEGFYELTDAVVTGVDALLREYGLPYLPRAHCFLACPGGYVDLTEGNCTGKNGLIQSYSEILPVKADQTDEEVDRMYRSHYEGLCSRDERFAKIGVEGLLVILKRCVDLNLARCNRTIAAS